MHQSAPSANGCSLTHTHTQRRVSSHTHRHMNSPFWVSSSSLLACCWFQKDRKVRVMKRYIHTHTQPHRETHTHTHTQTQKTTRQHTKGKKKLAPNRRRARSHSFRGLLHLPPFTSITYIPRLRTTRPCIFKQHSFWRAFSVSARCAERVLRTQKTVWCLLWVFLCVC